MSFTACLEAVDHQFYFGIGGIGDLLLLLSTFYDKLEHENQVDVVFVCNNVDAIRRFSKIPAFNKIRKWWLYPRSAFYSNVPTWDSLMKDENCLGTGVTPRNFDYIGDWIECGKSDVFKYYGVNKHPRWANKIIDGRKNYMNVVIQPFGGADDSTKQKAIPNEDLMEEITGYFDYGHNVTLLGSKSDVTRYPGLCDFNWVFGFEESFMDILTCDKFIGADSWGKTLSGLAGIPTRIYPNIYPIPVEQLFGHPVDPSDYVFLKNWGFSYADGRSF